METLATVDMAPAFAGEDGEKEVAQCLKNAAQTVGFFYLVNHGLPSEIITNAYDQLHKFFDLPLGVKMKVHTSLSAGVRGYIGLYEQVFTRQDKTQSFPYRLCGRRMAFVDPHSRAG